MELASHWVWIVVAMRERCWWAGIICERAVCGNRAAGGRHYSVRKFINKTKNFHKKLHTDFYFGISTSTCCYFLQKQVSFHSNVQRERSFAFVLVLTHAQVSFYSNVQWKWSLSFVLVLTHKLVSFIRMYSENDRWVLC